MPKKVILKLRGENGYSRTIRMNQKGAIAKLIRWQTEDGIRYGHIKKLRRK